MMEALIGHLTKVLAACPVATIQNLAATGQDPGLEDQEFLAMDLEGVLPSVGQMSLRIIEDHRFEYIFYLI